MTQPDGSVRRVYVDTMANDVLTQFQPADPMAECCPRCGADVGERCLMLIAISTDRDGTRVEYYDPSRAVSFHRERRWLVRGK